MHQRGAGSRNEAAKEGRRGGALGVQRAGLRGALLRAWTSSQHISQSQDGIRFLCKSKLPSCWERAWRGR